MLGCITRPPESFKCCRVNMTPPHEIMGATHPMRNRVKDIVQIGGREVNPISKKMKRNEFLTKVGEGGVTKHIVKNRCTLFCMIYYSIWPNQLAFPSCVNENENAVLVIFKQVLEYWSDFERNITDRINTVRFLQILDGWL